MISQQPLVYYATRFVQLVKVQVLAIVYPVIVENILIL